MERGGPMFPRYVPRPGLQLPGSYVVHCPGEEAVWGRMFHFFSIDKPHGVRPSHCGGPPDRYLVWVTRDGQQLPAN